MGVFVHPCNPSIKGWGERPLGQPQLQSERLRSEAKSPDQTKLAANELGFIGAVNQ